MPFIACKCMSRHKERITEGEGITKADKLMNSKDFHLLLSVLFASFDFTSGRITVSNCL